MSVNKSQNPLHLIKWLCYSWADKVHIALRVDHLTVVNETEGSL